ncbi:hypothetical protein C8J57DRAFT_1233877 [Mycena rebaudengoi]|nr:hypothetical protein C8J57DRAFT_1233877 [Mycena rebaudengoi]
MPNTTLVKRGASSNSVCKVGSIHNEIGESVTWKSNGNGPVIQPSGLQRGTVKVPLLPQTAAALPQVAAASAATMLQCRRVTLAHTGCHRRLQNSLVEFNSASNGSQSMSFDNIIDNNVGNFYATNIYILKLRECGLDFLQTKRHCTMFRTMNPLTTVEVPLLNTILTWHIV